MTTATATVTETRWVVRAHNLPEVTVEPQAWEPGTDQRGLYTTREAALRAAAELVQDSLRESQAARHVILQELDSRIRASERQLRAVHQQIHDELLTSAAS